MTEDPDIRAALYQLARAFPNAPVTADTFQVYAERLARFDSRAVRAAILHRIDRHKFSSFPTIGEIQETIFELCPPDRYPTPDEAWGIVRRDGHHYHDAAAVMTEALEDVGGRHAIKSAESDGYGTRQIQTRFLERYRELLAEARQDSLRAPDVQALIADVENPLLEASTPKRIGGGA